MNSDHTPIILILSEDISKKEAKPTLVNKFTDWESFKIDLEKRINLSVSLRNEEQLEKELFVENILQAAWKNTPKIRRKITGNNYPKEIQKLINENRKLRRIWQQSRAPQDKTKQR